MPVVWHLELGKTSWPLSANSSSWISFTELPRKLIWKVLTILVGEKNLSPNKIIMMLLQCLVWSAVPTSAQNPATTTVSQSGILFGWLSNGWKYCCCVWNSQNCCLQGIVPVDWWVHTRCYCSMWSGLLHHHDSPPLSWGFTKESWSVLLHYNVVAKRCNSCELNYMENSLCGVTVWTLTGWILGVSS